MLLISNKLGCLFCDCCWAKKEKLTRLYEKGSDRIEDELDIVQLTKWLRRVRILVEKKITNKKEMY